MSMLNVRLSEEDEKKLDEILTKTKMDRSSLVRKMIADQWMALQLGKTFVERAGGHPKHLLNGPGNLSDPKVQKAEIAKALEEKRARWIKPDDEAYSD